MAKRPVNRSLYFTGYCSGKYHAARDPHESVPLHLEVFDITITELEGRDSALSSGEAFDAYQHDLYCHRVLHARCEWQGKLYEMRLARIKVQTAFGFESVTQDSRSSFARFEGPFCAEAVIDDLEEVPDPEPDPIAAEPIRVGNRTVPTGSSCMGGCVEGLFQLIGILLGILLFIALLSLLGLLPFLVILALLALLLFGGGLLAALPIAITGGLLRLGRGLLNLVTGLLSLLLTLGFLSFLLDRPNVIERTRSEQQREHQEIKPEPELTRVGDDTLITHRLAWDDYSRTRHQMDWQVRKRDARSSWTALDSMGRDRQLGFKWEEVYGALATHDHRATALVTDAFERLGQARTMDAREQLEAMVTCVQSIPYSLVLDIPCPVDAGPCKGMAPFGLNPPAGFVADLKGDCDTRALLLYSLLDRKGYDVAILLSERYTHAMLGVAARAQGAYLAHEGKRYYFWETTARGFRLGELHPRYGDLRYWRAIKPILQNQPAS